METLSVRIPENLKNKLKELHIDYSDEIRNYLIYLVKKYEIKSKMENIMDYGDYLEKKYGEFEDLTTSIREDRNR